MGADKGGSLGSGNGIPRPGNKLPGECTVQKFPNVYNIGRSFPLCSDIGGQVTTLNYACIIISKCSFNALRNFPHLKSIKPFRYCVSFKKIVVKYLTFASKFISINNMRLKLFPIETTRSSIHRTLSIPFLFSSFPLLGEERT